MTQSVDSVKMNTSYKWFLGILMILCLLVSIGGWYRSGVTVVDYDKIAAPEDVQVITTTVDVDALTQSIVDKIVLPEAKDLDNQKIEELWEVTFGDCINELKGQAYDDVINELDDLDINKMDDLVDFLEANIEDFDELKSVKEDKDETKIEVVTLGACENRESEDDKEAVVNLELNVKYRLKEGQTIPYKETVYVTGTVRYDEDITDIEDIELVYSL